MTPVEPTHAAVYAACQEAARARGVVRVEAVGPIDAPRWACALLRGLAVAPLGRHGADWVARVALGGTSAEEAEGQGVREALARLALALPSFAPRVPEDGSRSAKRAHAYALQAITGCVRLVAGAGRVTPGEVVQKLAAAAAWEVLGVLPAVEEAIPCAGVAGAGLAARLSNLAWKLPQEVVSTYADMAVRSWCATWLELGPAAKVGEPDFIGPGSP